MEAHEQGFFTEATSAEVVTGRNSTAGNARLKAVMEVVIRKLHEALCAVPHRGGMSSEGVGDGAGVIPWIHLDDAASATVLALEHDGPALYNIVDDDPAPAREWLPALASALGAKPPRRFPVWLARLFAGEAMTVLATEARGAWNAKAKRELGWTPRHESWRTGFQAAYAAISGAERPRPGVASEAA